MNVLFKNARVLTFDEADRKLAATDMLVEGPVIAAIGDDLAAPAGTRIVEAAGHLLMPGLVNGHLHSPGNLMKGSLDDRPLELFMLYEVPPLAELADSPRLHYLRTLRGAVEMLKLGETAVLDDAFFISVPTPEAIDALMGAYRDDGLRATVTLDQPNVPEDEKYPFLTDLLAELRAAPRLSGDELLGRYRDFIGRWHGAEGGRLRCAARSRPRNASPRTISWPWASSLPGTTCPSTCMCWKRGSSASWARSVMASRRSATCTTWVPWTGASR